MPINKDAVGAVAGPAEVTWDARDVMLYALSVGAGQADPSQELALTTENTAGHALRALPTFALVLAQRARVDPGFGDYDRTQLVHATQTLEMAAVLPVSGSLRMTARIAAIEDKRTGALVSIASEAQDLETGQPLFTSTSGYFIRGEGGFDPERKSGAGRLASPDRAPDIERTFQTRLDQALIYRLNGDRNPLHSDPVFAARGGFPRPILHGLGTYGITIRELLGEQDIDRMKSVTARFTRPVVPGDTLHIQAWREPEGLRFRTVDDEGRAVLDGGFLTLDG